LDGFIVGACMELMRIEEPEAKPVRWKPPDLLVHCSKERQYQWLCSLAREILNKFVKCEKGIPLSIVSQKLTI
jgi:hypothetical protein